MDPKIVEMPEQVYLISRWRGIVLLIIGIGFVLLGTCMLRWEPTSHFSKFELSFVGLLEISFFGAATAYNLLNVIIPSRLIIGSPGFILKRPLFQKKIYWWKDIDRLWLTNGRPMQMIAWTYKAQPDSLANAERVMASAAAFLTRSQSSEGYDGVLPWGWSISTGELLTKMQDAHHSANHSKILDSSVHA